MISYVAKLQFWSLYIQMCQAVSFDCRLSLEVDLIEGKIDLRVEIEGWATKLTQSCKAMKLKFP